MDLPLLLAFRALVRSGAVLGVRDYLDLLRALEAGFGRQPTPSRAALLNLCQILWCRSAEERRLLEVAFAAIPHAANEEIKAFGQQWLEEPLPNGDTAAKGQATDGASGPQDEVQTRVSLALPDEPGGIGLPSVRFVAAPNETFVLQTETYLSPRELAILWWRLRRPQRGGQGTDIDLDRSVQVFSRFGAIQNPIMRSARHNTASVLILIDVGSRMAPWKGLVQSLEASLPLSRLRRAEVIYFSEVPDQILFEQRNLRSPVTLDKLIHRCRGLPVLILSEIDAAKRQMSRARLRATREFLAQITPALGPVVWINPMPRVRWHGTTAGAMARQERRAAFLPLDRSMLFQGIDVLRGAKTL